VRALLIALFLCSCSTVPVKRSPIEQYRQYRTVEELKRYLDTCPPGEEEVALELALEIAPADLGIRERFARYLMERGRLEESSGILIQILKEEPAYASAYLNLATISLRQGRSEEALSFCSQGRTIAPADPRFRRCLSLIGKEPLREGVKQGILGKLRVGSPL
jgi:Flp pilus assembly protein TadD